MIAYKDLISLDFFFVINSNLIFSQRNYENFLSFVFFLRDLQGAPRERGVKFLDLGRHFSWKKYYEKKTNCHFLKCTG